MENFTINKLINMTIKIFFRFLLLCFFAQASIAGVEAQKISDIFISLSVKDASVKETLTKIEKQTVFKFAYSKDLESNTDQKLFVNMYNKSVKEILENISLQTGLAFRQINRTISVRRVYDYYINPRIIEPANNGRIFGTVTSTADNEPLIGANVFIKGTSIGTAADFEGNYEIIIPESIEIGSTVEVNATYVGYKAKIEIVSISGKSLQLDFSLREDIFQSEEIVVTGIASKTSKSVAEVAISRIKADELTEKQSFQDVSQLLSGKVAGVRVENTSGGPGSGTRFNVRSGGGLNGNGQPLIIIDGIRMENFEVGGDRSGFGSGVNGAGYSTLSEINPEDIDKIEVLKGPAAAASYGTNGSNGVVLITTKKGKLKPGKDGKGLGISVNYKHVSGWNERGDSYEKVYPYTFERVHSVFRDGPIKQNSVSVSGGIPTLTYRVSLDQRDEDGTLPNQYLNKVSYRANFDAYPSEKISLSVSAAYSEAEQRRTEADNNIYSLVYNTSRQPHWNWADSAAILERKNLVTSDRFLGSVQGTYRPIENLDINGSVGLDYSQIKDLEYIPPGLRFGTNKSVLSPGNKDVRHRRNLQATYNFNATYKLQILKNLQLTSIVGAQLFERRFESFAAETDTFSTPLISDLDAGADFTNIGESFLHLRNGGILTEHSFYYRQYLFCFLYAFRKDSASTIGAESSKCSLSKS